MMKKYLLGCSLVLFSVLFLMACKEEDVSTDSNANPEMQALALQNNQAEVADRRPIPETITDQIDFNGLTLMLVDRQGGCLLKTDSAINPDYQYLKPMAPCYFVRQANQLQTFAKDDVTVIALVGTPVKGRCGQESQGLLIKEGVVTLSTRIGQGSTFCADSGLDSFHFSLFLEE
jgi:hypothetical protein